MTKNPQYDDSLFAELLDFAGRTQPAQHGARGATALAHVSGLAREKHLVVDGLREHDAICKMIGWLDRHVFLGGQPAGKNWEVCKYAMKELSDASNRPS